MHLPLITRLTVALALFTTACGGTEDDGAATTVATTPATPDDVRADSSSSPADTAEPTPTESPTTTSSATSSTATSIPATTVPPATTTTTTTSTPTTTSTTTPPVPCDQSATDIRTPSGRRVVLRNEGIETAAPTVLVIHGFTGTPSGIERVSDLTATANAAGVAVAYPEGTPVAPEGFGWNTGAAEFATEGVDDGAALVEMLAALVATGCVDPSRVTITGESNGAGMTLAALCDPRLAGAFRSAVMVIPAVDEGVLARCGDALDTSIPLVAVAGRIDRTAPFDGGNGLLAQPVWFGRVAANRGCAGLDAPVALTETVDRYATSDCTPCTELLVVADGPHTWPGTPIGTAGLRPGTFDLNRRIIADVLAPAPDCLSGR